MSLFYRDMAEFEPVHGEAVGARAIIPAMLVTHENRAGCQRVGWEMRAVGGLLCIGVFAAAGCASQPMPDSLAGMRVDASQVSSPEADRRASYEYHVLAGEMAIQRGNRVIAAREYVAALDYSGDKALAKRATRIALFAGKPELAYRAADIWASSAPDSVDAQRTAVRLALSTGDRDGLSVHAPALVSAAASAAAGYSMLADVVSGEPAHADTAIEAVSRMAQADRESAPAQYALGVVALRYGRDNVAARAAERALRIDPDWHNAVLLQAGVWIREGDTGKARDLVAGLPGNAANRAQYHLALARLLVEADQDAAALEAFERAIALQPDNPNARYGLAVLALSVGDLDRAEKALNRLYEAGERADDAAYYLGTLYEQRAHYDRAQLWYQRVENGGHAFEAQVRAARMIWLQDDMAGARERLAQLRETFPQMGDQLYGVEGRLLFEANRPQDALDVYNEGLENNPDNPDLRYGRSIAYERLDRVTAAEDDLRAILAEEPDDVRALNALGYLLTNHTTRYTEALDHIQQALEIEPDNPAILDSMGWLQYRMGNPAKAREYLERAYSEFQDPEVAAHLGEVLWKQGHRTAARRIWRDALEDSPNHPVLRETVERLQQ